MALASGVRSAQGASTFRPQSPPSSRPVRSDPYISLWGTSYDIDLPLSHRVYPLCPFTRAFSFFTFWAIAATNPMTHGRYSRLFPHIPICPRKTLFLRNKGRILFPVFLLPTPIYSSPLLVYGRGRIGKIGRESRHCSIPTSPR